MVFYYGSKCEELINEFHPSQLEQKFGGSAPDLDVFWPPKEISKEYGVDPSKIKRPEYNGSADADFDDDESVSQMKISINQIMNEPLRFNHKLQNLNNDSLNVEEIKFDLESENKIKKMKKPQDSHSESIAENLFASKDVQPEAPKISRPTHSTHKKVGKNSKKQSC
mmetsp:Transcript_11449/g.13000  ORF Transcript_11449/g.13000 Transcript_11449/m.13000 type:complete len:167 (+) Transcript_11449:867-1367(+)